VLVPAILFSLVAVIVRSTLLTQLRDIHGFLSGFSPHGIMSSPFTAVRTVADLAFGLGSHADNGSSEVAKRTQFFWVRSKDLEGHSCFFGISFSVHPPAALPKYGGKISFVCHLNYAIPWDGNHLSVDTLPMCGVPSHPNTHRFVRSIGLGLRR
jgi:hypothetical protein